MKPVLDVNAIKRCCISQVGSLYSAARNMIMAGRDVGTKAPLVLAEICLKSFSGTRPDDECMSPIRSVKFFFKC